MLDGNTRHVIMMVGDQKHVMMVVIDMLQWRLKTRDMQGLESGDMLQ